jgi:hypothetical protein
MVAWELPESEEILIPELGEINQIEKTKIHADKHMIGEWSFGMPASIP